MKASTTAGEYFLPLFLLISRIARTGGHGALYGLLDVMASKPSATETIAVHSGIMSA